MTIFQVSSRYIQEPGPPRKRNTRLRNRWYVVVRVVCAILIITALTTLVIQAGFPLFLLLLLPVCIGIVTTRFQLSNILHRTPMYGLLTICLALIYFGGITGLQILVHSPGIGLLLLLHAPETPVIIIVTTTLFFAVLLEPVRNHLQVRIEQHFNLRDHEASRAIEAFNSTLREEIDLDQLRERLLAVIQKTMQPQSVSVWVRKTVQQEPDRLPTQARRRENGWSAPDEGFKHEPYTDQFSSTVSSELTVADTDPIIAYALNTPGTVEIDQLHLDSPVLRSLKTNGVEVALPLASQGELIGLLTLGSRVNGQEYVREDRTLLNTLAAQVAPALRVAQMVQEQQMQVRERERIEQELRTAQFIQRSLLPEDVPTLSGWQIAAYYQPAREVGGDFYDFLSFEDGRLGIIIGDVTDKGVPAALVMATTHTMLRTIAQETVPPGEALAKVNNLLYAEIPPRMFVTCFYAILDPANGRLHYANAGQDLPCLRHDGHASELWATGMPLGMMAGTCYEEREVIVAPGESLLFYSDGLVEAHNRKREMFGLPRLMALIGENPGGSALIGFLLSKLAAFTGDDWEQEDDVTMVTLQRAPSSPAEEVQQEERDAKDTWHLLAEWTVPSVPGNEQQVMEQVTETVQALHLSQQQLARLKSAVAEATMNAMEHGNQYRPDTVVALQVLDSQTAISVRIRDSGMGDHQPISDVELPDLEAKLAGRQAPRGWGFFLIKNLVDELHVTNDEYSHTVEVIMHREGANNED